MSKIISILHVPGADEAQVMSLFLKLRNFIKQIDFSITNLRIYTRPQLAIKEMETERDMTTLIVGWAVSEAETAFLAIVGDHLVGEQRLADLCRAVFVLDMGQILIPEILQGAQDRVGQ